MKPPAPVTQMVWPEIEEDSAAALVAAGIFLLLLFLVKGGE